MSRGPGTTQHDILCLLNEQRADRLALAVSDLAAALNVSDRQIRRAVHALADRGLVDLTTMSVQLGQGGRAPVKLYVWLPERYAQYKLDTDREVENLVKNLASGSSFSSFARDQLNRIKSLNLLHVAGPGAA